MRRDPIGIVTAAVVTSFLLCAAWAPSLAAQGLPTPSASARACAYFPVAELEALFAVKAKGVQGLDQSTRDTCSASFPGPDRAAAIESHPPSAVDAAMTVAQRLAVLKQATKLVETRDFGSIGCFRSTVNMGKTVHATACFLAKTQYLSLSVHSVDEKQVSIDTVKDLLEKAAARRK